MANDQINLSEMTRQELESLRADVDRALATHDERRRKEALAAAEAAAKEAGFTLAELTDAGRRRAGKGSAPGKPKYVHPDNPAKTWTGKGRQPSSIKEALEGGKSLDDFAIVS